VVFSKDHEGEAGSTENESQIHRTSRQGGLCQDSPLVHGCNVIVITEPPVPPA
jgi:hypothetical protein